MISKQHIFFMIAAALLLCMSHAYAEEQAAACKGYSAEWQVCEKDSDCVIGRDACGFPAAYNEKHLEDAEKYAACLAPMIECDQPSVESVSEAICKAGVCSVDVKIGE